MSDMDGRQAYASDLSEDQWVLVERELPPAPGGGRHRTVNLREVVNAIFYRLRTGCSWEMLPHDFPPKELLSEVVAREIEERWRILLRELILQPPTMGTRIRHEKRYERC